MLFQTPNRKSSLQFYVIHDFDILPEANQINRVKLQKQLILLIFRRIKTSGGSRLIKICSKCDNLEEYSTYACTDWLDNSIDTPSLNSIFTCKHSIAVISCLLIQSRIRDLVDKTSATIDIDIVFFLTQYLSDDDISEPNGWVSANELRIQYQFSGSAKEGCIAIHISEAFDLAFTVLWIPEHSEKPRCHCFECPRSDRCKHVKDISAEDCLGHPFVQSKIGPLLLAKSQLKTAIHCRIPGEQEKNQSDEESIDVENTDDWDNITEEQLNLGFNPDASDSIEEEYDKEINNKISQYEKEQNDSFRMYSTKSYPDEITDDEILCNHIVSRLQDGIAKWIENESLSCFESEIQTCPKCVVTMPVVIADDSASLFSLNAFLLDMVVKYRRCPQCDQRFYFDGRTLGILNFGNKTLIACELFYELLKMKVHGGFATYSYWKTKVELNLMCFKMHPDVQEIKNTWMNMSGRLHRMLVRFVQLIDYPSNIMQCCKNPGVICIDGIVLSIKSDKLKNQNLSQPWIHSEPQKARFSTRKYRSLLYIYKKEDKDILQAFRNQNTGILFKSLNLFYIGVPLLLLRRFFNKFSSNPIAQFLFLVTIELNPDCTSNEAILKCHPLLSPFVHCLYKDLSAASSVCPTMAWIHIKKFIEEKLLQSSTLQKVQDRAPVLGSVFKFISLKCRSDHLRKLAIDMCSYILETAKNNFISPSNRYYLLYLINKSYKPNVYPINNAKQFKYTNSFSELEKTGYFFPGRPIIRTVKPIPLSSKIEPVCNKDYKQAGKFGAGTLLFWCADCSCCIGFDILKSAESVQHVYNVLVTRFTQMPRVIIYDNGCNLHEYILNRSPGLFFNTLFLSDGFHWKNHSNCCECYNSKAYSFLDSN